MLNLADFEAVSIPGLLWRSDSPARGTRVGLLRMRKALCCAGAQVRFLVAVGGDLSLRLFVCPPGKVGRSDGFSAGGAARQGVAKDFGFMGLGV